MFFLCYEKRKKYYSYRPSKFGYRYYFCHQKKHKNFLLIFMKDFFQKNSHMGVRKIYSRAEDISIKGNFIYPMIVFVLTHFVNLSKFD